MSLLKRAVVGALGVVATMLMVPSVSSAQAAQPTVFPPESWVKLVNVNSGKCMDVANGGTHNGADVFQWECHGGASQQWIFAVVSPGMYELVNRNSFKCLDVENWGQHDGANIYQWECRNHDDANQQWLTWFESDTIFRMQSFNSGKCMDVENWGTHNGANIHQWSCRADGNVRNQQWYVVPVQ